MESYEGNRVKWLIDKLGCLFLTRRGGAYAERGVFLLMIFYRLSVLSINF